MGNFYIEIDVELILGDIICDPLIKQQQTLQEKGGEARMSKSGNCAGQSKCFKNTFVHFNPVWSSLSRWQVRRRYQRLLCSRLCGSRKVWLPYWVEELLRKQRDTFALVCYYQLNNDTRIEIDRREIGIVTLGCCLFIRRLCRKRSDHSGNMNIGTLT